jgi:dihydrofolate synthase/folylpolyglutamate synthase
MFSKVGAAGSNFSLDNIRTFCEKIGNPQDQFKSIHVAGTNGKGTTCHLLKAVYQQAGYTTGMFTSPHLLRYNERVRISGEEIADEQLIAFFNEVSEILSEIPLTYFEISTALAFWTFAREEVDIAIIEAGLGGRLDSTNIITPELSIITSIGFDHQDILGETINEIAVEKAGIIKPGVPVVVGDLDEESMRVIEAKAAVSPSQVKRAASLSPRFEKGLIELGPTREPYQTQFFEPVNRWNVAIVKLAVDTLKPEFRVSEKNFRKALADFKGVPARFEKLQPDRDWYFSGSHNAQAVHSMMEAVGSFEEDSPVLVFSMMKDKVNPEILEELTFFEKRYFYEQEGLRAAKLDDIRTYISAYPINEENQSSILNELQTSLVIFAGSFYFYPIVKRWLL